MHPKSNTQDPIVSKVARVVVGASIVLALSACEMLDKSYKNNKPSPAEVQSVATEPTKLCMQEEHFNTFGKWCRLQHWLEYALTTQDLNWQQKKQRISELGATPVEVLEKVLLSQGSTTPYKDRLRAQAWVSKVQQQSSPVMQAALDILVVQNSQQLLEFESAIAILSRVNARHEREKAELQLLLVEKQQQLEKQQQQVKQLLKIESDLNEQNRNANK